MLKSAQILATISLAIHAQDKTLLSCGSTLSAVLRCLARCKVLLGSVLCLLWQVALTLHGALAHMLQG